MAQPDMRRMLVVKLAGLGDLITALPAISALRDHFPEARLELLTTPAVAEFARALPAIDGVLSFDKYLYDRPWEALSPRRMGQALRLAGKLARPRYDAVLLLHHLTTRWGVLKFAALALATRAPVRAGLDNGRGWFLNRRVPDGGFGAKHEAAYWVEVAALLGAKATDASGGALEFKSEIEKEARRKLSQVLGEKPGGPRIFVHPGVGSYAPKRRWPAERFAALADALVERHNAQVFLMGGPAEMDLTAQVRRLMVNPAIDLGGRLSLVEVAILMQESQLFVGGDSGLAHLAGTVRMPLVAIFGPTNPAAWAPLGARIRVVRRELDCSPCLYTGHRVGDPDFCPRGRECLEDIRVEEVLEACRELLPDGQA